MDRRARIRLELDRRVSPGSVSAETVRLISGARSVPLSMEIDVVRPGLVLVPRVVLDPEITYVVEVGSLRDLDGNLGAPTPPISFHTGTTSDAPPAGLAATFDDVAPIFAARCAISSCHQGDRPILGLDLSSAEAIRTTAVGVTADELRRPVEGASAIDGPALTGLPIIEPGTPARSYLVYKLLGDPHAPGSPMPPTGEGGEGALSATEIDTVVSWIRGGALLPGPS